MTKNNLLTPEYPDNLEQTLTDIFLSGIGNAVEISGIGSILENVKKLLNEAENVNTNERILEGVNVVTRLMAPMLIGLVRDIIENQSGDNPSTSWMPNDGKHTTEKSSYIIGVGLISLAGLAYHYGNEWQKGNLNNFNKLKRIRDVFTKSFEKIENELDANIKTLDQIDDTEQNKNDVKHALNKNLEEEFNKTYGLLLKQLADLDKKINLPVSNEGKSASNEINSDSESYIVPLIQPEPAPKNKEQLLLEAIKGQFEKNKDEIQKKLDGVLVDNIIYENGNGEGVAYNADIENQLVETKSPNQSSAPSIFQEPITVDQVKTQDLLVEKSSLVETESLNQDLNQLSSDQQSLRHGEGVAYNADIENQLGETKSPNQSSAPSIFQEPITVDQVKTQDLLVEESSLVKTKSLNQDSNQLSSDRQSLRRRTTLSPTEEKLSPTREKPPSPTTEASVGKQLNKGEKSH